MFPPGGVGSCAMHIDFAVKGYLAAVIAGYVVLCSTLLVAMLR